VSAEILTSQHNGHLLEFNERTHIYRLDGIIRPGVTTVNKGGYPESEALIRWRIKQGIGEYETKAKATEAANIGTLVHEYAYLLDMGMPTDDVQERIRKHKDADKINGCVDHLMSWRATNQDRVIAAENIIAGYDKGGDDEEEQEWFCGKFDRLASRDGLVVLSDYKTSSGIFVEQFVQLAAYAIAIKYWMGITVDALEIVRFGKKDNAFETKLEKSQAVIGELKRQFRRNLRTYYFRKRFEK